MQNETVILENLIKYANKAKKVMKINLKALLKKNECLNEENKALGYKEEAQEGQYRIYSVKGLLNLQEKIYKEENHRLFYRGVSNKAYAENDIPGIFRPKKENSKEIWVTDEDKMFYELIAESSNSFKTCKTTFEYLTVMQHYEYPTRLLDITTNPLVALYFACDGFATLKGKPIYDLVDGQLIIYSINNKNIRNHESDRVSLLSNLTMADTELTFEYFLLNEIKHLINQANNLRATLLNWLTDPLITCPPHEGGTGNNAIIDEALQDILDSFPPMEFYDALTIADEVLGLFQKTDFLIEQLNNSAKQKIISTNTSNELTETNKRKLRERSEFLTEFSAAISFIKNLDKEYSKDSPKFIEMIQICLDRLSSAIKSADALFPRPYFKRYCYKISGEKISFNPLLIKSKHIQEIQCVLPKKDNPRIIAQQGAFLLFGFAKDGYTKKDIPSIPVHLYAKLNNKNATDATSSGTRIEIVIPGHKKGEILEQLANLGISNATLFPEIDVVSNTIKERYK